FAGRSHVQGGRSAGAAAMSAIMNDTTLKSAVLVHREIPHTVSPGLWTLAWRRLCGDGVAMVSLALVAVFVVMMILSGTGIVAKDWAREIGMNYAPPTFMGPDAPVPDMTTPSPAAPADAPAKATEAPSD